MKTDYLDLYFPDPQLFLIPLIDHILFIVSVVHLAKFWSSPFFISESQNYCEHTDEEHVYALYGIFNDFLQFTIKLPHHKTLLETDFFAF